MYATPLTMALATAVMATTASASVPAGWSFGGCMILDHFEENITPRYVDTLDSSSMTIELCLATCTTAYAGIDGNACYCGTTPFPTLDRSLDYECNTPCPGDASETCGGSIGFGWVSLYSKVTEVSSSSSNTVSESSSASASSIFVPLSNATASASLSYSTSTIYATSTATITSCAATVTNCPLTTSTTVYAVGTTIVPCSTIEASSPIGISTASASSVPVTSSSPTSTYVASASMLTSTSIGSNATIATSTPSPTSVFTGDASVVGKWGSAALLMIVGVFALL